MGGDVLAHFIDEPACGFGAGFLGQIGGGFFHDSGIFLHLLPQLGSARGDFLDALLQVEGFGHRGLRLLGQAGFFLSVRLLGGGLQQTVAVGLQRFKFRSLLLRFQGLGLQLVQHFLEGFGGGFKFLLGRDESGKLGACLAVFGAELRRKGQEQRRHVDALRREGGKLPLQLLALCCGEKIRIGQGLGSGGGGLFQLAAQHLDLIRRGRRRFFQRLRQRLARTCSFILHLTLQQEGGIPPVTSGLAEGFQRCAQRLAQAAGERLVALQGLVNDVAKLQPGPPVSLQLALVGGQKVDALPHEKDHDEHQHDDGHAGIAAEEVLDHRLGIEPQDRALPAPEQYAAQRRSAGRRRAVHAARRNVNATRRESKIRRRDMSLPPDK